MLEVWQEEVFLASVFLVPQSSSLPPLLRFSAWSLLSSPSSEVLCFSLPIFPKMLILTLKSLTIIEVLHTSFIHRHVSIVSK